MSDERFKAARKRLLRMHFEAKVGHIGGNLSAIDAMLVIFHEYLGSADCFVLSKGHAAGALYTSLWSVGRLSDHDLTTFHQDGSLLAGHPPAAGIPDIRFATGSLGHGLSLAAGTALGLRMRSRPERVYCLMSDGEWQEVSTWEGLIFATHQRLTNLTVLIAHNELQGFGTTTSVASMAPLWDRLRGFDAEVAVVNGHDTAAIRTALDTPSDRLKIVVLKTVKGHGVSFMEHRMEWHYLPLSAEQYAAAIAQIDAA